MILTTTNTIPIVRTAVEVDIIVIKDLKATFIKAITEAIKVAITELIDFKAN